MAEAVQSHLSPPSGLLELCALLGPPRDSLRGPELVKGEEGRASRAGVRRWNCGLTTRCAARLCTGARLTPGSCSGRPSPRRAQPGREQQLFARRGGGTTPVLSRATSWAGSRWTRTRDRRGDR